MRFAATDTKSAIVTSEAEISFETIALSFCFASFRFSAISAVKFHFDQNSILCHCMWVWYLNIWCCAVLSFLYRQFASNSNTRKPVSDLWESLQWWWSSATLAYLFTFIRFLHKQVLMKCADWWNIRLKRNTNKTQNEILLWNDPLILIWFDLIKENCDDWMAQIIHTRTSIT